MISSSKLLKFLSKSVKYNNSKHNKRNNMELWMKIEKYKAKKVL